MFLHAQLHCFYFFLGVELSFVLFSWILLNFLDVLPLRNEANSSKKISNDWFINLFTLNKTCRYFANATHIFYFRWTMNKIYSFCPTKCQHSCTSRWILPKLTTGYSKLTYWMLLRIPRANCNPNCTIWIFMFWCVFFYINIQVIV